MKIAKACGLIPNDTTITTGDPIFMDVTKPPFRLYGLYEPFRRVPEKIAAATSDAVANLAAMTAGARLRFSTDSDYVVIHAEIEGAEKNPLTYIRLRTVFAALILLWRHPRVKENPT